MLKNLSEEELQNVGIYADEMGFETRFRSGGITCELAGQSGNITIQYNLTTTGGQISLNWDFVGRNITDGRADVILEESRRMMTDAMKVVEKIKRMSDKKSAAQSKKKLSGGSRRS